MLGETHKLTCALVLCFFSWTQTVLIYWAFTSFFIQIQEDLVRVSKLEIILDLWQNSKLIFERSFMGFTELKAHQWRCVFIVLRQYNRSACCESVERCNQDIITLFVCMDSDRQELYCRCFSSSSIRFNERQSVLLYCNSKFLLPPTLHVNIHLEERTKDP